MLEILPSTPSDHVAFTQPVRSVSDAETAARNGAQAAASSSGLAPPSLLVVLDSAEKVAGTSASMSTAASAAAWSSISGVGSVEGEGPVNDASLDLAAAAHLRKKGRIHRRRHIGIHHFNGCEGGYLGAAYTERMCKFYDVLNYIDLDLEIRIHVECGV